jgi:hypothetical protein
VLKKAEKEGWGASGIHDEIQEGNYIFTILANNFFVVVVVYFCYYPKHI